MREKSVVGSLWKHFSKQIVFAASGPVYYKRKFDIRAHGYLIDNP